MKSKFAESRKAPPPQKKTPDPLGAIVDIYMVYLHATGYYFVH